MAGTAGPSMTLPKLAALCLLGGLLWLGLFLSLALALAMARGDASAAHSLAAPANCLAGDGAAARSVSCR